MPIAIYARKSSESEDRQVQSLDDQIRALKELAKREGLAIQEVYQEAKSAKAPYNRPEFDRLTADITAGRITGLLTWSINRLSRNDVDGGLISHLLRTEKLEFIRTIERTYRPQDNALILAIENGMAIAFLQDHKRAVSRGMRGRFDRGWHVSKAKVGYKNDFETREIVPDPDRFPMVRAALDMVLNGNSNLSDVYRWFAEQGVTVRTKRKDANPISRSYIHAMFRDRFYVGQIQMNGEWRLGKHLPMLTEGEFARVQIRLAEMARRKKPLKRSFPFAGALACEKCGCAVIGEERTKSFKSGRTVRYVYYHCTGSKGCPKTAITETEIVDRAIALAESLKPVDREVAGWIKDSVLEAVEQEASTMAQAVSNGSQTIEHLTGRLNALAIMRADGELEADEYAKLRQGMQAELGRAEFDMQAARTRGTKAAQIINDKLDMAVAAHELDGRERDVRVLGAMLRTGGPHYLNLKSIRIRFNEVLEKIATFEPLRNGSEKPKRGDFLPRNSIWWNLVDDLLMTATECLACNDYPHAR